MKPWEKYAQQPSTPTGAGEGPWKKYAGGTEPQVPTNTPMPAPQAQRSMGQEFMRQLGLTGRAALTGLGGTVGLVGDALNEGINRVAGTNLAPVSKSLQDLGDRGGDAFDGVGHAGDGIVGR